MKDEVAALQGVDDPEFENEWSDIKQAYIEFQTPIKRTPDESWRVIKPSDPAPFLT